MESKRQTGFESYSSSDSYISFQPRINNHIEYINAYGAIADRGFIANLVELANENKNDLKKIKSIVSLIECLYYLNNLLNKSEKLLLEENKLAIKNLLLPYRNIWNIYYDLLLNKESSIDFSNQFHSLARMVENAVEIVQVCNSEHAKYDSNFLKKILLATQVANQFEFDVLAMSNREYLSGLDTEIKKIKDNKTKLYLTDIECDQLKQIYTEYFNFFENNNELLLDLHLNVVARKELKELLQQLKSSMHNALLNIKWSHTKKQTFANELKVGRKTLTENDPEDISRLLRDEMIKVSKIALNTLEIVTSYQIGSFENSNLRTMARNLILNPCREHIQHFNFVKKKYNLYAGGDVASAQQRRYIVELHSEAEKLTILIKLLLQTAKTVQNTTAGNVQSLMAMQNDKLMEKVPGCQNSFRKKLAGGLIVLIGLTLIVVGAMTVSTPLIVIGCLLAVAGLRLLKKGIGSGLRHDFSMFTQAAKEVESNESRPHLYAR